MASGLMRASAIMAAGTIISRALGLVKVIVLAMAIGQTSSITADAFANGNLLPNTIYVILMGGILNAVLVPQIVKAATNADGGEAYINKVLTLVMVALAVITVLAMLGAPFLVWLFQMSWGQEQLALAAAFAYWSLPQIFFYGLYTVMGEVLNAKSIFGPYTWAPVLNNVVSIAGIIAFMQVYGSDPTGARSPAEITLWGVILLAGSATIGVAAQALILSIFWKRAGIRYRPDFAWRRMGLGATAKIAGWSLAMIVVIQFGGWVTSNVSGTATGLGPSSSALGNAWLVLMLPHSVLAVSLATAYFTRFSEAGRDGRMTDFRRDFSASIRQVSFLMIYASLVIFVTAPFLSPIIERGSTLQVDQFALVLQVYVFALAPFSFLFVVQRSFYALSDTKTPFIFTTVQQAIFIVLALLTLLVEAPIRGAALSLAYAIATIVQALLATWMLRRKIGQIDGKNIVKSLVKFSFATIPALAAGLALTHYLLNTLGREAWVSNFFLTLLIASVSGIVYAAALLAMRASELTQIVQTLRSKITS